MGGRLCDKEREGILSSVLIESEVMEQKEELGSFKLSSPLVKGTSSEKGRMCELVRVIEVAAANDALPRVKVVN